MQVCDCPRWFVYLFCGLGVLFGVHPIAMADTIIDNFADGHALSLTAPGTTSTTADQAVGNIIGSERDVFIEYVSAGIAGQQFSSIASSSQYSHGQNPTVVGTSFIMWDGNDNDPTTTLGAGLDPTGLGGIDLTEGGTVNAVLVRVASMDLPTVVRFTIYTDMANFSTFDLTLPGATFSEDFLIPFTSFSVASGAGADFTNVGAITMFVNQTNQSDRDLVLDVIQTTSQPDLTATKDDSAGGSVGLGGTFTWTIEVDNVGAQPATFSSGATILRDELPSPAGISYSNLMVTNDGMAAADFARINCQLIGGDEIVCTASGGDVAIAGLAGFDVSVLVDPPDVVGNLDNPGTGVCEVDPGSGAGGGTVGEGDETNNTCSDSVSIIGPDLQGEKTNNTGGFAQIGVPYTWTIVVNNTGSANALFINNDRILTDSLPSGGSYTLASVVNGNIPAGEFGNISCAITGAVGSQVLNCDATGNVTIPTTNPGFTINITATPTSITTLNNVCTLDPNNAVLESNENNNSNTNGGQCSDSVTVQGPDLQVQKTNDTGSTIDVGGTYTWTMVMTNNGQTNATFANTDVIFQDDLPVGPTYSGFTVTNNNVAAGSFTNINCAFVAPTITCTATGAVTLELTNPLFTIEIDVTTVAVGSLVNPDGVCAIDPNDAVQETNNANNSCSNTVNVQGPDLIATKNNNTAGLTDVAVPFIWTIEVRNSGAAAANFTAASLTIFQDDLPTTNAPNYTFLGIVNQGMAGGDFANVNCAFVNPTITCTTGAALTIGSSQGFDVRIQVMATAQGTLTNPTGAGNICAVDPGAVITESNEANNTCLDAVVVGQPSLFDPKTVTLLVDADNDGRVSPGDTLAYNIFIRNDGTANATNVTLTDDVPDNTTLVGGSLAASVNPAGPAVTIVSGNLATDTVVEASVSVLAPAAIFMIDFEVIIDNPLPPGVNTIDNQGLVSSDTLPPSPTDDPLTAPFDDPTIIGVFNPLQLVGGDPPIWENIMAFPTPEGAMGVDLNGDGDTLDTVLRYKDLDTGEVTNVGVAVSGRHRDVDMHKDTIVFVEESQYAANVIGAYNIKTQEIIRTGVVGYRPTVYENIISVSGDTLRFYDLNTGRLTDTGIPGQIQAIWGNNIAYHRTTRVGLHPTIRFYNIQTGRITNTKVAGHSPAIYENWITYASNEEWLNEDLNGDGDTGDSVIGYYDIHTQTAYNTQQVGAYPAIYGHRIVFTTNREVRYHDILTGETFGTGKLGTEPDIFEDTITYYLWEQWTLDDLSGDGDRLDPIVRTYEISSHDALTAASTVVERSEPKATPLRLSNAYAYQQSGDQHVVHFRVEGTGIQEARVEVFNLSGHRIHDSGFVSDGVLRWQMLDQRGRRVSNGVYLYVITLQGDANQITRSQVKKLAVLR